MRVILVVVFLVAACCWPSVGQSIESTFDLDADGWTVENAPSAWLDTGGNPGGFLQAGDRGNAGTHLVAPPKFLGDLSSYDGGRMSLDLFAIRQPGAAGFPWTAQISSSSASVRRTIDEFPYPTAWHSYSLPLVASAWGTTQSEWLELLSNVSDVRLILDATESNNDAVGLDNFRIQIPEPPALCLAVLGLLPWVRLSQSSSRQTMPQRPEALRRHRAQPVILAAYR